MSKDKNANAWHTLQIEALYREFASSENGISDDEAAKRREKYGPNSLEADEGVSLWMLVLRQLKSPLIYLLLGAALLSFVVGHAIDGIVILSVVLLNTVLGVVQEWRAEKALAAIRKMSSPGAHVIRDGKEQKIDAKDVIPGDIMILETGDRIPADGRLIFVRDLAANESTLTGESEPIAKISDPIEQDIPIADRKNMVFMSTIVTGGRGRALVVATGMKTFMGEIAGQVRSTEREETPLQRRISRLANIIGMAGVAFAGALFIIGLLEGYNLVEMALYAVAVAVSAIPEGLPAAISVTLALGVQRMADRHAIIKRLPAVETLGSTTVICSDKTGTITRNEMTVTKMYAGNTVYEVSGQGYAPEGKIEPENGASAGETDTLSKLLVIGAFANNAELLKSDNQTDGKMWNIQGSPTEGAILVASRKAQEPIDHGKRKTRLDEVPFSSDLKYMAALYPDENSDRILYVKGAPDRLLNFCRQIMIDGEIRDLREEDHQRIKNMNSRFAGEGLRVLAGAYKPYETGKDTVTPEEAENNLVFIGLWGILDPARPDAVEAIADAKKAGITVVMLTGDHGETATAIARKAGIGEKESKAVTGRDIESLEGEELAKRIRQDRIFARVSPGHKMKILETLQDHGEIVAMTGDGVNDAPALKTSNIGIAMGRAGTEVAKEAADMVLTDDNFATIVHAIEEGRIIFGNLRRAIFFLITTNLGEIITLAAALLLELPLPLVAVMILWINLVTDGVCVIPLGIEPVQRDVLADPPLPPKAGILDRPLVRRILLLAPVMAVGTISLFAWMLARHDLAHAQSTAFVTLAAFQWFHALNARSRSRSIFTIGLFSNRWLFLGISAAIVLQILAVHTAVGQTIFGTVSLTVTEWGLSLITASSILWIDELFKLFHLHGKESTEQKHEK